MPEVLIQYRMDWICIWHSLLAKLKAGPSCNLCVYAAEQLSSALSLSCTSHGFCRHTGPDKHIARYFVFLGAISGSLGDGGSKPSRGRAIFPLDSLESFILKLLADPTKPLSSTSQPVCTDIDRRTVGRNYFICPMFFHE